MSNKLGGESDGNWHVTIARHGNLDPDFDDVVRLNRGVGALAAGAVWEGASIELSSNQAHGGLYEVKVNRQKPHLRCMALLVMDETASLRGTGVAFAGTLDSGFRLPEVFDIDMTPVA